jgi:hypothetical protein
MPTEAIRARVVRLRRQPGLQVIADRHDTRPFVRITAPAFAVAALAVLALTRIIDVRGFGVIMLMGGIISLIKIILSFESSKILLNNTFVPSYLRKLRFEGNNNFTEIITKYEALCDRTKLIKVIPPLIDEFYYDFSTRDNISYGKLVRFFIQKAS